MNVMVVMAVMFMVLSADGSHELMVTMTIIMAMMMIIVVVVVIVRILSMVN